jgi:plastocyanin
MIKRVLAVGMLAVMALSLGASGAIAGGGCHSEQFVDAVGVRVDLRELCFTPTVIRIQPGISVTWTNRDPLDHTVTGAAYRWGSMNTLVPGRSISFRFQASGVYPYGCLLHPGMVGAVVVGDGTSSKTTTQAVVPVLPATGSSIPAPQTVAPQPVPAVPASDGVSNVWRILAIAAIALLVVALGGWAAQRLMTRRGTVKA